MENQGAYQLQPRAVLTAGWAGGGKRMVVADLAVAPAGARVVPPHPVEVAKARTVLKFWFRLRGVAAPRVPRRGREEVGAEHPILSVEDGRMRSAPPAGLDLDGDP
ncbi:hypothetical protein TSOC_008074 [Tetrabaena socialis]|uniref:Uncharacterized protein n=1 Tax=Tetrabaena socialis TaxID=47790 RepID=A0A2J7ZZC8_9CHLO|nr:hypothetical protein TSOC_008071 [Tetrabaena socialis]PNH05646.1 hypothetical protein TSOC_008074 [Tetrabaena socialis]|eukprot:PNH05637.1 hypothetical protein TSOC_008071 [Tetrabaena socialis]